MMIGGSPSSPLRNSHMKEVVCARRPGSFSTCTGVSSAIANDLASSFLRRYAYMGRKKSCAFAISQFANVVRLISAPHCFQSCSWRYRGIPLKYFWYMIHATADVLAIP